jgi:hypothetical protein
MTASRTLQASISRRSPTLLRPDPVLGDETDDRAMRARGLTAALVEE